MAKFIEPKFRRVHRDYIGLHINNPVNIEFWTELIKCEEPNGYGTEYPIIYFKGCNVKWYYGKNGSDSRDEQYRYILDTFKLH